MRDDFREHRSEVRGQSEIAPLVQLLLLETRPLAVHSAATNVAADHEQRTSVTMVRSAVAVLARHPAKFRHRHDDDVVHAIAEVSDKSGNRSREIIEPLRQLAG